MKFQRGETAYVSVDRREYKGNDQVHIRLFSNYKNDTFYPTKKGVTINPEEIPLLIEELTRLHEEYQSEEKEVA
jgi:hypothetical protein